MNEEIKSIAEIRHLKRSIKATIVNTLFVAGVFFCMSLAANHRSKKGFSLGYAGASVATLVGGQVYLRKLEKRKEEASKRLRQLQREHS